MQLQHVYLSVAAFIEFQGKSHKMFFFPFLVNCNCKLAKIRQITRNYKCHTIIWRVYLDPILTNTNFTSFFLLWNSNSIFVSKTKGFYSHGKLCTEGQLTSKCLFGVFTFFQKTKENKSSSSKVEFFRSFFGRNDGLKNHFEFVWPLVGQTLR